MSQDKPMSDNAVDAMAAVSLIILAVVTAVYWVSQQ